MDSSNEPVHEQRLGGSEVTAGSMTDALRYSVAQFTADHLRGLQTSIDRVSERIMPGLPSENFSGLRGVLEQAERERRDYEQARRQREEMQFSYRGLGGWHPTSRPYQTRNPGELVVEGIPVRSDLHSPDDRIYVIGRETRTYPLGARPIWETISPALVDYVTLVGRSPDAILLAPQNFYRLERELRQFLGRIQGREYEYIYFDESTGATTSTPISPRTPLSGFELRKREAMSTEGHRVHITTRLGYKKTVRVPGTIGETVSIAEDLSTNPENSNTVRRDYRIIRKAIFEDCLTHAITHEYWAVEND